MRKKISRFDEILVALILSIPVLCIVFSLCKLSYDLLSILLAAIIFTIAAIIIRRRKEKRHPRATK